MIKSHLFEVFVSHYLSLTIINQIPHDDLRTFIALVFLSIITYAAEYLAALNQIYKIGVFRVFYTIFFVGCPGAISLSCFLSMTGEAQSEQYEGFCHIPPISLLTAILSVFFA